MNILNPNEAADTLYKTRVMKAYVDGVECECRAKIWDDSNPWIRLHTPSWNWDNIDYRIKPVKKERLLRMDELPPVIWVKFGYTNWHLITERSTAVIWVDCYPNSIFGTSLGAIDLDPKLAITDTHRNTKWTSDPAKGTEHSFIVEEL